MRLTGCLPQGGGVGPHVDNYDVFLLQGLCFCPLLSLFLSLSLSRYRSRFRSLSLFLSLSLSLSLKFE